MTPSVHVNVSFLFFVFRAPKLFHGPGWLSCIADPLPAVAVVAAAAAGVRPALSARLVRSADAGQGAEEAALLAAAEAMAAAAASGPNADKGRKIRDVRDLFAGMKMYGLFSIVFPAPSDISSVTDKFMWTPSVLVVGLRSGDGSQVERRKGSKLLGAPYSALELAFYE